MNRRWWEVVSGWVEKMNKFQSWTCWHNSILNSGNCGEYPLFTVHPVVTLQLDEMQKSPHNQVTFTCSGVHSGGHLWILSNTSTAMPSTTERQQITEALHKALLFHLITELEQDAESSNSSSSSGTSDDDTSNSDSEECNSQMEDHIHSIAALYTNHYYNNTCKAITKTCVNLQWLMEDYKINHPEIFRSYLWITPDCFDNLVSIIKDEGIFHNNSNNKQMSIAHQVAIALSRFGHYGNAVGTVKVALWSGYGYGTVQIATKHVMAALCSEWFCQSAIRWSSEEANEEAKAWVEHHSCPRWQDGWLMVDGTLVPLYLHPAHYSNNWFNWKSNYSLNIQVTTTSCLYEKYDLNKGHRSYPHLIFT